MTFVTLSRIVLKNLTAESLAQIRLTVTLVTASGNFRA